MSALSNLFQDIADAIRDKTGGTDKMNPAAFPAAIAGIEAGGSADVRYVTFLNHDESALGRKAVAVGDDCADPIARGVFSTPERESDVQYDYTFAGWSTTKTGSASSTALKSVGENRTVYAAYTAAVRYYTVTYYDSDGTTVLKTESLAYGTVPSYEAEKEGFGFGGWTPERAPVTGNASYTASWQEKITFANASWNQISEISDAGEAENYFKVGDTKEILYDGQKMEIVIAGFKHDDLADGSGKAGISFVFNNLTTGTDTRRYDSAQSYDLLNNYMNGTGSSSVANKLPSELVAVIKPVIKKYLAKSKQNTGVLTDADTVAISQKLWLLSLNEMGIGYNYPTYVSPMLGSPYAFFSGAVGLSYPSGYQNNAKTLKLLVPVAGKTSITSGTSAEKYWIRDVYRVGYHVPLYVTAQSTSTSALSISSNQSSYITAHYRCGFCI